MVGSHKPCLGGTAGHGAETRALAWQALRREFPGDFGDLTSQCELVPLTVTVRLRGQKVSCRAKHVSEASWEHRLKLHWGAALGDDDVQDMDFVGEICQMRMRSSQACRPPH